MKSTPLDCPHCKKKIAVQDFFEACDPSWPNQGWTHFTCPECKEVSQIQLSDGLVEYGDLDGGPGPCFFPNRNVWLAPLKIKCSGQGISVRHGRYRRLIPAKP